MSKTVNTKQRVSRGDFFCALYLFSIIFAAVYVEIKIGAGMGAMSASAMYMY